MVFLGIGDPTRIAHSVADPFFGPATRLHGATYAVDVEIHARELGPHPVIMDIGALRASLRRVLETLDCQNLDDHPAFPGRTSTTERVAEHVATLVAEDIAGLSPDDAPRPGSTLRVLVRESPTAYAGFERALQPVKIAWVLYGALDQTTGGTLYDRLVIERLRAREARRRAGRRGGRARRRQRRP